MTLPFPPLMHLRWTVAWATLLAWALLAPMLHAQGFPALTGRVVDAANLLSPAQEISLDTKLEGLEKQSRRQLVIVTIPDLGGYDIADYGFRLGDHWGIGDKERDDGALLIVAPQERKVRIEVGYGLEGVLTDAVSARIIRNAIIPHFRNNDFPGGITAGTDALIHFLQLPPEEARKVAAEATEAEKKAQAGSDRAEMIFVILFILLFFVLPMFLRSKGGKAYRGGSLPVILWGPGMGGGNRWGGGRGGGFGGGFGSGGFSGGGGGFGGGGASGGW